MTYIISLSVHEAYLYDSVCVYVYREFYYTYTYMLKNIWRSEVASLSTRERLPRIFTTCQDLCRYTYHLYVISGKSVVFF